MKKDNPTLTEALKQVMDPELFVNIVDLGLVYETSLTPEGTAKIVMTLTTPGCPMSPVFEAMIVDVLKKLPQVKEVEVRVTFDPPWSADKMNEEARRSLGF